MDERSTRWSKWLNAAAAGAWLLMVPIAWGLQWLSSVQFISAASIYANFASHVAALRADVDPNTKRLDAIEAQVGDLGHKLDRLLEAIEGTD
jgi:hypothetical protein